MKLTFGPTARLISFAGSFLLILTGFGGAPSVEVPIDKVADSRPQYVFCGFTGVDQNYFAMAVSSDGEGWNNIPEVSWKTPTEYVNAPTCLMHNGSYLVHAAAANEKNLHLRNWYLGTMRGGKVSTIANVDWADKIPGLDTCYSGEWFIDDQLHLFIPCTADKTYRSGWKTYETHPLSGDLTKWSDPVDVHVSRDRLYDSTVLKVGATYYMWTTELYGQEPELYQSIQLAKSDSLLGPYAVITTGDWSHWGREIGRHEAPTPYRHGSGWRMAMEQLKPHRMVYSDCDSIDFEKCNWSEVKPWKRDREYRHGTVRPIS